MNKLWFISRYLFYFHISFVRSPLQLSEMWSLLQAQVYAQQSLEFWVWQRSAIQLQFLPLQVKNQKQPEETCRAQAWPWNRWQTKSQNRSDIHAAGWPGFSVRISLIWESFHQQSNLNSCLLEWKKKSTPLPANYFQKLTVCVISLFTNCSA